LNVLGRFQLGELQYADLPVEMGKLPPVEWDALQQALRNEAARAAQPYMVQATVPAATPVTPARQTENAQRTNRSQSTLPLVCIGERNYQIGETVIVVEDAEETILQAFFADADREAKWVPLSAEVQGDWQGRECADGGGIRSRYGAPRRALEDPERGGD
jgi:hypothetical protein